MDRVKELRGWDRAVSLEDYVFKLFEEKKTDSDEFKCLVRIYGRDHLKELWNKYIALHNAPK